MSEEETESLEQFGLDSLLDNIMVQKQLYASKTRVFCS
jgi:hypothetical protein